MAMIMDCVMLCLAVVLATSTTSAKHHSLNIHANKKAGIERRQNPTARDDLSYKDILEWTERHADSNRIIKNKLTLGDLKTKVLKTMKRDGPLTCAQRTVKSCDLRAMARLQMVDDSPCSLLQEYQMCIERESSHCESVQVTLLTSSVRHLVAGLQKQGHCAGLVNQPEMTSAKTHVRPARPCARKGTWMCMASLVEDLKDSTQSSCTSFAEFRHCLHERTASCNHDSTDLLIRGSKGLSRLYRRLTQQC